MNYNDLSIEQLKALLEAREAERDAKAKLEQVITSFAPAPVIPVTKPYEGIYHFHASDLKEMHKHFVYFRNGTINSKASATAFLGRKPLKSEYVSFMYAAESCDMPISRRRWA